MRLWRADELIALRVLLRLAHTAGKPMRVGFDEPHRHVINYYLLFFQVMSIEPPGTEMFGFNQPSSPFQPQLRTSFLELRSIL